MCNLLLYCQTDRCVLLRGSQISQHMPVVHSLYFILSCTILTKMGFSPPQAAGFLTLAVRRVGFLPFRLPELARSESFVGSLNKEHARKYFSTCISHLFPEKSLCF